jgi:hypothetical protein
MFSVRPAFDRGSKMQLNAEHGEERVGVWGCTTQYLIVCDNRAGGAAVGTTVALLI